MVLAKKQRYLGEDKPWPASNTLNPKPTTHRTIYVLSSTRREPYKTLNPNLREALAEGLESTGHRNAGEVKGSSEWG